MKRSSHSLRAKSMGRSSEQRVAFVVLAREPDRAAV
jgi:hypothetical protein